jgi:hypothetical protein
LVILWLLISEPDTVPAETKRYITPLSAEALEELVANTPPRQRLVYQKRLKAAAERAVK